MSRPAISASGQVAARGGSGVPTVGGEAPVEFDPSSKFCVEENKPLCESVMWKMLQNYYSKMAIEAWKHNYVPSFVTSNSRLARSYARVILNYLKDWYSSPQSDHSVPVTILEIGGGHGRFTYLCIKALLGYQELFSALGLPARPFVYVFSDVAEANVAFVSAHPRVSKMKKDGWLDFAFFDGNSTSIDVKLLESERLIPRDNPVVVIANYVLDSLLTDAWQLTPSAPPRRVSATIYSSQSEQNPEEADIMLRMSLRWSWTDVNLDEACSPSNPSGSKVFSGASDYLRVDPNIRSVLDRYIEMDQPMSFVLPVGAFSLVKTLMRLSGGKLFCLVGDKGYPGCEEFKGHRDPHIAIHGSISFMVNLHALRLYFDSVGGFSLATPYKDTFQLTALWACGDKDNFGFSRAAFSENIYDMPPDGLIQWQKSLLEATSAKQDATYLKSLMTLLRYSGHDPDVMWTYRKIFTTQCVSPILNPRAESDLAEDLQIVYDNWYKLRDDEDIPDLCGHICMKLGRCAEALPFFEASVKYCPESVHAATFVNMASCYKVLGNIPDAIEYVDKALERDPNYSHALQMKAILNMCQNPVSIALIGCGAWTRFEAIHLLKRDKRCNIKAIFAFNAADTEALKAAHNLGDEVTVYGGSAGLAELLQNRDDIKGCLVDVHAQLLASMLPKIWKAGKHVLARTPLTLSVANGVNLVETFSKYRRVAWYMLCSSRGEEAFYKAKRMIEKSLGTPIGFAVRYVTDSALNSGFSTAPYEKKEALAIEMMRCLNALKVIVGGNILELSAQCAVATNTASQATAMSNCQEPQTHNLSASQQGSAGNYPAMIPSGTKLTTIQAEYPRLVGWATIANPSFRHQEVSGSILITHHAGDNCLKYTIYCSAGTLEITRSISAWQIKTIRGASASVEETASQSVGHQNCHDAWLKQVMEHESGQSAEVENPDETVHAADLSVHEALSDAAEIEGILVSIEVRLQLHCASSFSVIYQCAHALVESLFAEL
eukprot:GHVT01105120.1.p1 GENE.GHVT01105120.1~~GHVT01105120.1.p1  ORF type:complete len:1001 (-),score=93.15 GHVT01105120.1:39-3041(-)